jgi:outer membrane immunogenic protein
VAIYQQIQIDRRIEEGAMTRLLSCAGALALFFAAQASFAADMPARVAKAPAAVVAPPFSWTGPYWGLHCGAAWGRSRTSTADGFDNADPTVVKMDDTGWLCGAQGGYNWHAGSWLYGVESDIGYLALEDRLLNQGDGDDLASFKFKSWYGTLTGRIGPTWDRSALYLKGGAAVARIRHEAGDANGNDTGDFTSVSKTKWGWALGAGYEQALSPDWSWKLEYLYMDFGKITSGNQDGNTFEHRNRVHTVKLGVNYHFATGKYPVAPVVTKY